MINFIATSLIISISAFTYSVILTEHGMILNKMYTYLYVLFKTDDRLKSGRQIHPLYKVLIYCCRCVAGQWALWFYLYMNYNVYSIYIFFNHVFFVLLTIFFTEIIKSKLWN